MLSFYNRAKQDARYLEALGALESKLNERGQIIVERPHRNLAGLWLCAKGRPSDLATARYHEIRMKTKALNEQEVIQEAMTILLD